MPKRNSSGSTALADLKSRPQQRSRSPKASVLAARDLATYIVESGLEEGAALPREGVMAEQLGIGRTTMREALRLLETQGVLTIRSGPGGGPVVRLPRPADLGSTLTLMLQFNSATFGEVAAARSLLEPLVAHEAAGRIKKRQIAELREVNEDLAESGENRDSFAHLNRRFHGLIAAQCGNILLEIFTDSALEISDSRSVGIDYPPPQVKAIVVAHERIVKALESGDADAAANAMREHLVEANNFWRKRHKDRLERRVQWI
jgi:DNA-binding FadR family transcriptional regulator